MSDEDEPLRSRQWYEGNGQSAFLHRDAVTVGAGTVWDQVADAEMWNNEVIRGWEAPLCDEGRITVLRSNLAPRGAVLKPAAASPGLSKHRVRAVVFSSIEDYHARVNDPDTELAQRAECFAPALPAVASGYQQLYRSHVEQADLGCDFDFADASQALSRQRVSH